MPARKVLPRYATIRDSIVQVYDSVGNAYYKDARQALYPILKLKKKEMEKAMTLASTKDFDLDSLYSKMRPEERRQTIDRALINTQQAVADLDFKSMITSDGDKLIRMHDIAEIK